MAKEIAKCVKQTGTYDENTQGRRILNIILSNSRKTKIFENDLVK